jgi:DNA-binding transcriptional ArsR family regulator
MMMYVPRQLRNRLDTFDDMDAVLSAIADESRRTVLEALRHGPATVTELAALLHIARPGVSRHLRVLREAGLVDVQPEAQWGVYRLRTEVARGKRVRRSKP